MVINKIHIFRLNLIKKEIKNLEKSFNYKPKTKICI